MLGTQLGTRLLEQYMVV